MDQRTAQRQPAPRLRTNLDTDFLKLIAILSMLLDHIGAVFFPEHPAFRWVGRLAFPIFCYCLDPDFSFPECVYRHIPDAQDTPPIAVCSNRQKQAPKAFHRQKGSSPYSDRRLPEWTAACFKFT